MQVQDQHEKEKKDQLPPFKIPPPPPPPDKRS